MDLLGPKVISIVRSRYRRRTLLPHRIHLARRDRAAQRHSCRNPSFSVEPTSRLRCSDHFGVSVLRGEAKLVVDYLDREHLRFSSQRPQDFWQSVQTTSKNAKTPPSSPMKSSRQPPLVMDAPGQRLCSASSKNTEQRISPVNSRESCRRSNKERSSLLRKKNGLPEASRSLP